MKILYLHQHFSTPKGASGTRSYEMAKRLVARGHQVTMVCGSFGTGHTGLSGEFVKGKRQGLVDGIQVIELQLPYSNHDGFLKRSLTFLKFSLLNVRIVLQQDFDLLFATSTPLTVAVPGILGKWLKRKPFVFEVRDLWPELPKAMGVIKNPVILKLMDWLESLAYKSADACIGLSPGIVEGIKHKQPNKKVAMIPNGCDLELFEPQATENTNTGLTAVFTGTHGLANGLDILLDVAKELKARSETDIVIRLVGEGKCKPALQRDAEKSGLLDILEFEPARPKHELQQLFAEADLGLMILANIPAFYYGTSPNKFFDYLSAGLPVLNNYPGWLADMIQQNNLGKAVAADDAKAFADALVYLRDNKQELTENSRNARALAEREFGRDKLGQQFVDFLESQV